MPFLLTGCLFTQSVTKTLHSKKYVGREFKSEEKKFTCYTGVDCGEKEINGKKFQFIQFSGVLEGKNRILELYLPKKYSENPIIKEKKGEIQTKNNSYLYIQKYVRMNSEVYAEKVIDPSTKLPETPFEYLKSENISDTANIDVVRVASININNIFHTYICSIVWTKRENKIWTGERNYFFDKNTSSQKEGLEINLKWKKRSKCGYYATHLLYLISVPVDIVTLPFQALFLRGMVK